MEPDQYNPKLETELFSEKVAIERLNSFYPEWDYAKAEQQYKNLDIYLKNYFCSKKFDEQQFFLIKRCIALTFHKVKLMGVLKQKGFRLVQEGVRKKHRKNTLSSKTEITFDRKESRITLALLSSEIFYSSREWKEYRIYCFSRIKNKCNLCGSTEKLQLDHILPRHIYPEKAFEFGNMQILCESCNKAKGLKRVGKEIKLRKK